MSSYYSNKDSYYKGRASYYDDKTPYYQSEYVNKVHNLNTIDLNARARILPGGFIDFNKEVYAFEGDGSSTQVNLPDTAWAESIEVYVLAPGGLPSSNKWLPSYHYDYVYDGDGYCIGLTPKLVWPTRGRFVVYYNKTDAE